MNKLGIVGGGAMGSAILNGLITQNYLKPQDICIVEADRAKGEKLQETLGIGLKDNPAELAESCDTIILAVKPHIVPVVAQAIHAASQSNSLIISIAAGVALHSLETWLPGFRIVRVMPNTPLKVGRGVTVYCPGKKATAVDQETAANLFGALGKTIALPENLFDAATAVSGSGPAYVFYLVEALIDAAVMAGLGRNDAVTMVTETFAGSILMLQQSTEHPVKLQNDVTSPGGTTAAALYELEKGAVAGTLMRAVEAAARRSRELGQK